MPDTVAEIQSAYFAMLKAEPFAADLEFADPTHLRIPSGWRSDHQPLVKTSVGWMPASFARAEIFLSHIRGFWQENAGSLTTALRLEAASGVHVGDLDIADNARLYLPFFERLLVSDQLMVLLQDYEALDQVADWRQFIVSVATVVGNLLKHERLFVPPEGEPLAVLIPAQMTLNAGVKNELTNSSEVLALRFMSAMWDTEFCSVEEYADHVNRTSISPTAVDDRYLKLLASKYLASTDMAKPFEERVHLYRLAVGAIVHRDLGDTTIGQQPFNALALNDLWARIREFERFGLDAATLNQQSAIDSYDVGLFDWWFEASARESSRLLGLGPTEDFLFKAAVHSDQLGFLQDVSLDEVLRFRSAHEVEKLRAALRLGSIRMQGEHASPASVADAAGAHVQAQLDAFVAAQGAIRESSRHALSRAYKGFGLTCAVTLASIAVPLLSMASLFWGRSAWDVGEAKTRLDAVDDVGSNPLAAIVEWRDRPS